MRQTHARFCITQLGFRPSSPKQVIVRHDGEDDEIVVHLNQSFHRHERSGRVPAAWDGRRFPWPFDLLDGDLQFGSSTYADAFDARAGIVAVTCTRRATRWGSFYVGELDEVDSRGIHTLEFQHGISLPFEISDNTYDRILRSYLVATSAQRSATDVPGVRVGEYHDDAVRDSDGMQIPAAGGWYDAGDHRKWTSTTAINLGALAQIVNEGPPGMRAQAEDELEWGRDYFLHLLDPAGQVPDNVGGGALPEGYDLSTWWFENHSGTAADGSGSLPTDGIPGTGDERQAVMLPNMHAQLVYVRELATAARAGHPVRRARSRVVAQRAWAWAEANAHDGRTLFVASELRAACALARLAKPVVRDEQLTVLAERMLQRQATRPDRVEPDATLSGYFMEAADADAYRSIAFTCEPALALLDVVDVLDDEAVVRRCADGVRAYVDDYLLADAASNVFGLPPYGVYIDPPYPDRQRFRPAGGARVVRTFMAPWNRDCIAHGNAAVVLQQAYLLARAGATLDEPAWTEHAERLLQWATGANPEGLSLFTGIGQRHPVAFSARTLQVPEAIVAGHIGRPDGTPYLETSDAIEWSTQEVWGVPFVYAAQTVLWLDRAS